MSRALRATLFGTFLAGSLTLSTTGFADDTGKCTIATKGDSAVVKACAKGGIKEAKVVMKDMTKKAKAAGVKMDCDDCHSDDTKYTLTPDGREKFKKMLAALETKK